jgi:hypothetical protein
MSQSRRTISETGDASGSELQRATPVRTRRSHKKSHNGCTECKQRHIRCDERRPACANCEIAERLCTYKTPQPGKRQPKRGRKPRGKQQPPSEASPSLDAPSTAQSIQDIDEEQTQQSSLAFRQVNQQSNLDEQTNHSRDRPGPTHYALPALTNYDARGAPTPSSTSRGQVEDAQCSRVPSANCCPGLLLPSQTASGAMYTSNHMILLHHAPAVPNFRGPDDDRNIVDIAIRYTTTAPYLLDEILAFTAFHLTSIYPGSSAELGRLATELQTRALNTFKLLTHALQHDDRETAVPRFLFSSVLGRHALAGTLQYRATGFRSFIDNFVECLNLNRGILAVTPQAWDHLYNSELQPFLCVTREAEDKIITAGHECDSINRLIEESDLNETSIQTYHHTSAALQWCFDVCRRLSEDDFPQAAVSFLVHIQAEYVDLLRKQRPEALIILAYYGVVLYRCRGFWAFRDAGSYLIRSIAEQLGTYWQEALAWPLHVLGTEPDHDTSTLVPRT